MENETKSEGFYFPEFMPPPTPEEFQKNSKQKTKKKTHWLLLVVKGFFAKLTLTGH